MLWPQLWKCQKVKAEGTTRVTYQSCRRPLRSRWPDHPVPMYSLFLHGSCESLSRVRGRLMHTYVCESTHSDTFMLDQRWQDILKGFKSGIHSLWCNTEVG